MSLELKKFSVTSETTEDSVLLRFSGYINEDADFEHVPVLDTKSVYLDLESVDGTNSLGLKKWILWITEAAKKNQFVLDKCPSYVVQQMSILQGFVPRGARINSIFVPYYCEGCGNEEQVLHENGSGFSTGTADSKPGYVLKEGVICKQCSQGMEPDILPESYFKFLFQK